MQYVRMAGLIPWPYYRTGDGSLIHDGLRTIDNILDKTGHGQGIVEEIERYRVALDSKYHIDESDQAIELDEDDVATLQNKAYTWMQVIGNELKQERRMEISKTAVLDLEQLLENPESIFEEQWCNLPEGTKQDLIESSRALAAHCPTAAVIMSLRAVEDLLREWYKQELEIEEVQSPWGTVLRDLEEEFTDKDERPTVLSNLDYLREKRNEVNHPDRTPSIQEAAISLMMLPETIADIQSHLE